MDKYEIGLTHHYNISFISIIIQTLFFSDIISLKQNMKKDDYGV